MPLPSRDLLPSYRPSDASPASRDDPLTAIGLALCAGMIFSCSDATSKVLSASIPPVEIAWLRWVGFVAFVLPMIVSSRGAALRSNRPRLQLVRAFGLVGSSTFFITGLNALPLASATTINFLSPLFVTLLSIPMLGERIGSRRWAATGVGLIGVLIVVRPGSGTFGSAAIWPILSSVAWAVAMTCTRRIGYADETRVAMGYAAVIGFVVLSLLVPFDWVTPDLHQLELAVVVACAATGGQYLTVLAYRRAAASLLAPFSYAQLIWASAFGFVLFDNVPDLWTGVGAAIIIASGLYTVHRERVRAHDARPSPDDPKPIPSA